VDDYRARQASGAKKQELTEAVLAWARDVGESLDELGPEQRKEVLRMVVDEVTVDRENNLDITRAILMDDDSVSIASQPSPRGGEAGGRPQGARLHGRSSAVVAGCAKVSVGGRGKTAPPTRPRRAPSVSARAGAPPPRGGCFPLTAKAAQFDNPWWLSGGPSSQSSPVGRRGRRGFPRPTPAFSQSPSEGERPEGVCGARSPSLLL